MHYLIFYWCDKRSWEKATQEKKGFILLKIVERIYGALNDKGCYKLTFGYLIQAVGGTVWEG